MALLMTKLLLKNIFWSSLHYAQHWKKCLKWGVEMRIWNGCFITVCTIAVLYSTCYVLIMWSINTHGMRINRNTFVRQTYVHQFLKVFQNNLMKLEWGVCIFYWHSWCLSMLFNESYWWQWWWHWHCHMQAQVMLPATIGNWFWYLEKLHQCRLDEVNQWTFMWVQIHLSGFFDEDTCGHHHTCSWWSVRPCCMVLLVNHV